MTRTGDGWCPFATQIEGVTTFSDAPLNPVGFCDHAAGGFYTTLSNPGFWNGAGVSVHFGVSRKGEICQIVNLFESPFAQGILNGVTWPPYAAMGQHNPNTYLISTEHEDWYLDDARKAHAVPGSEWTPEEYAADLKLKRWCIEEVRRVKGLEVLRFGIDSLAGHYMFDRVNRAECPGRFWRDEYRQRLWEDLTMADEPTVNEQLAALVALAHFIRNGWSLADLSPQDKAAVAFAAGKVPE